MNPFWGIIHAVPTHTYMMRFLPIRIPALGRSTLLPVLTEIVRIAFFYLLLGILMLGVSMEKARFTVMAGPEAVAFLVIGIIASVSLVFGMIPGLYATVLFAFLNIHFSLRTGTPPTLLSVQTASIIASGILIALLAKFQKRYEEKLRRKESRFRTLVEKSVHPTTLFNTQNGLVFISDSIRMILGTKAKDVLQRGIHDFIHSEDREIWDTHLMDVKENPFTISVAQIRCKTTDGSWVWIQHSAINLLHESSVQAVVGTLQDITRQKAIEIQQHRSYEREKAAREEAEHAVRERDEFLAIASHELKTPLSTLLLQLQSSLKRILTQSLADFSGERLVASLTTAQDQSKRLAKLIQDLLNVSLLSRGKLELERHHDDLTNIVSTTVERLSANFAKAHCTVTVHTDGPIPGLWDRVRLEQAISNLLTNVIKYAENKPCDVRVTSDHLKRMATISVKDEGIGIKREHVEKIFERFSRPGAPTHKKGLGIGLFIVRQITEAHGGTVQVASEYGHGTTFTITLPILQNVLPDASSSSLSVH